MHTRMHTHTQTRTHARTHTHTHTHGKTRTEKQTHAQTHAPPTSQAPPGGAPSSAACCCLELANRKRSLELARSGYLHGVETGVSRWLRGPHQARRASALWFQTQHPRPGAESQSSHLLGDGHDAEKEGGKGTHSHHHSATWGERNAPETQAPGGGLRGNRV